MQTGKEKKDRHVHYIDKGIFLSYKSIDLIMIVTEMFIFSLWIVPKLLSETGSMSKFCNLNLQ